MPVIWNQEDDWNGRCETPVRWDPAGEIAARRLSAGPRKASILEWKSTILHVYKQEWLLKQPKRKCLEMMEWV